MTGAGTIRTGIGGWNFDPWNDSFYPPELPKTKQLQHAASQLATIEINSTYYGSQKPATFAKWASSVPDGFVFSLKASRYCTNRKILAESGPSVEKFLTQGITELGDRLGPILWQFMPTKKFEPADFAAFLALLPEQHNGIALRHVVEARHESFSTPEFIELLAKHNVAVVIADHMDYPMLADVTADFVYARLQRGSDEIPTCYSPQDIDIWARRLRDYADGSVADDLPLITGNCDIDENPRDVFAFFITGGKINAPRGAMALQASLDAHSTYRKVMD